VGISSFPILPLHEIPVVAEAWPHWLGWRQGIQSEQHAWVHHLSLLFFVTVATNYLATVSFVIVLGRCFTGRS